MRKDSQTLSFVVIGLLTVALAALSPLPLAAASENHRMIILTDMLNEPDDSQTMVRLLMYANELDIEGLIAVSGFALYPGRDATRPYKNRVHPEEIAMRVEAYGLVRNNLLKHAPGWPTKEYLLSKIGAGTNDYGMGGVGDGKGTSGSKLIIEALEKPDPRPVYFCVNAGSNVLAQAIWDYRKTHTPEQLNTFIKKIRIYDDSGQDNAVAWISHNFPEVVITRSEQVFGFMGFGGPYVWQPHSPDNVGQGQHMWVKEHIQYEHGILGALYPDRMFATRGTLSFLEGGGTSTWIGLVNKGLYDPAQITWGGWGGRFDGKREQIPAGQKLVHQLGETEEPYKPFSLYPDAVDRWTDPETGKVYNDHYTAIQRWRRAFHNDFQARLDWCVKEYKDANHNPIAAFGKDQSRTIVRLNSSPGQRIRLDASASKDPDNDPLGFRWYVYPEAGTYNGKLEIDRPTERVAELAIPGDAAGKQIHVILEVEDNNPIVSLHAYRRIVIDVK